MEQIYYLSGSHNKKYPSKAHIMNSDGFNLCGVTGYWIETSFDVINKDGVVEATKHLPNSYNWCKKCVKKIKELNK